MSKPIGVGDKCLLIKVANPANAMKVVLVVAEKPRGGIIFRDGLGRSVIPHGADFEIESLGSPFQVKNLRGDAAYVKSIYARREQLRRLDDDDDSSARTTNKDLELERS